MLLILLIFLDYYFNATFFSYFKSIIDCLYMLSFSCANKNIHDIAQAKIGKLMFVSIFNSSNKPFVWI